MVQRLGLVTHGGKDAARAAADRVRTWSAAHGVPCTDIDVWQRDGAPRRNSRDEAKSAGDPDLVVTVGGDGTFLRGARIAAAVDALVLGIGVGRVGFLTEVAVSEVEQALDAVHGGQATVEERLVLTVRASRPLEIPPGLQTLLQFGRGPALPAPPVRSGLPSQVGWGVPLQLTALNDIVFEKLARDRQASVGIYLGSRLFASYSADAVIVASSTGSTAYSFAAGGPVLSPRLDALVFTPVAPHMIFDRSIVLPPDEAVAVRVLPRSGRVAVTADGELRGVLDPGDWVGVYSAPNRARIVRTHPSDFFGRLRDRFQLADAPAAAADGEAPLIYRPDAPVPEDIAHLHLPPTSSPDGQPT